MITAVNHVQVTIPKGTEAEARAYYCGVLGLEEIPKPKPLQPNGGFWLQLGALQVHIGTEDNPHRANSKAHIAYQITSAEHWKQRFAEAGYETTPGTPIPGFVRFDTRDPFGNRLEFIEVLNDARS